MGAETEFEKLLEKNDKYKDIVTKYESHASDKTNQQDFKTVETALDLYIEEKKQPKVQSSAELQKEAEMDMESCSSCQNYLNLNGDINKVLSKMNLGSDVEAANTATLQLNHLKFLYYTVKYDQTEGNVICNKYGNFDKIKKSFKGDFKLMAEEVFDLPNVNEVQYIPENGKEMVYLYRGVGSDSNKVYEVHMLPNGKGLIRFYNYTPSSAERLAIDAERHAMEDAQALDRLINPKKETPKDNFIDLGFDLKTRDKAIPTDVEVLHAGTKSELSSDLVLGTKTKLSFNEQTTEVSLADKSGDAYFVVNAKNKTEGKSEFVTLVPMSVNIDEKSKLNLNASVKSEVGIIHEDGKVNTAQTYNMNLTDHNNKYIEVELYQKPEDDFSKVSLSNKYSLGKDSSIGMNVSQDNLGNRTFGVGQNYSYGDSNSIGTNFTQDSSGKRTFSVGQNTNLGDYGKLKTEFGGDTEGKHFVSLQHEVAIGKASTLSIGARAEDGKQYSAMFQFKSRF